MKKIIKAKKVARKEKRCGRMVVLTEPKETLIDFLNNEDMIFINGMKAYITELKGLSPEKARQEAKEALFRTGVTDADGNVKENIVSWE